MRASIVFATTLLLLAEGAGLATASGTLASFMVAQGCAIGPATYAMALEAGHGREEIDALVAQAGDFDGTVRTGDWIVLPPDLCRIEPPTVRSEIRIHDPEVADGTSAMDAYAQFGDHGCFIDGARIMERVQETRGWDKERANYEYMRFVAENLREGSMALYGTDLLSTPAGLQILTGDCADIPAIDAIRQAQTLRNREFDALIRADAVDAVCGPGSNPSYRFNDIAEERTRGENTNAWLSIEVMLMTIGGGWYVGNGATEKGTPRPPLCRIE